MAPTPAKRAQVAERRRQAVQLRLAGLTYDAIAQKLGYRDRATAFNDITRALEQAAQEQQQHADILRQQELDRLDRLQAGAWAAALAGDRGSIEVILKIIDRRCKLLGLDAPQRHEVITLDAIDEEIRALSERLAAEGALPPATSGPGEASETAAAPGAADS